jgi:membrane fusion protein (multidrug efflux system)
VQLGSEVEIRIDMYPNKVFHGKVDSISGGSGTAFSLLPTQNATGNWVKIAQRVPVKVKVLDPDPKFPLRIGTSGSVRVKVEN